MNKPTQTERIAALTQSDDMVPVEGTIDVSIPIEILWQFFTNARWWPQWNDCFLWAWNTELVLGEELVWAFQPIRRWMPYRMPAVATIVELEPRRRVTWEVTALPGFYARHTYHMEDLGGGRTRFGSWEKGMGPSFRLMRSFWLAHFSFVKDSSLEGARLLEAVYRRDGHLDAIISETKPPARRAVATAIAAPPASNARELSEQLHQRRRAGVRYHASMLEDVVIMVPGFLGFAQVGGFYYFADRVNATVRAALQERTGQTIPVVPVCTLPTGSLVQRQARLVESLKQLLDTRPSIKRFHLIGHSAGGVDAHLLTCERPLGRSSWTAAEQQVRAKIASVVTIASPHHGTVMADSAQVLLRSAGGIRSTARMLWNLMNVIRRDGETVEAVAAALASLKKSLGFVWQIVTDQELIRDLGTASMARIRESQGTSSVPLMSFVTIVPPPGKDGDPFFVDLYRLTASTDDRASEPAVQENICFIRRNLGNVICAPNVEVPEIDACASDGIINSSRQLVGARNETFGGIVVADHADVMGHYDREDEPVSQKVVNAGLFHSGACFHDDQFFSLYGRVAKFIQQQIPEARSQQAA